MEKVRADILLMKYALAPNPFDLERIGRKYLHVTLREIDNPTDEDFKEKHHPQAGLHCL